ncbi:hapless 8 [Striga asiatica]|uniref:Hapless 8 n=1 Tax=Striga asiatica TaxID=4170 RepID=A0A5A7R8S4_STRAF|nr:hapless 8 [Striga asiatica]
MVERKSMLSCENKIRPLKKSRQHHNEGRKKKKRKSRKKVYEQMLSSENPPPDLSCSCKISQPKNSDEWASDDNPLPNFSIRGYVFGARAKDISNNWPFSQENLQLCLKYGVKDVLPPFDQTLDSVRNQSTAKCAAENSSVSRKDKKIPPATDQSSPYTNSVPENIVKLNNQKSSQEDTMASNVCPVCKMFSSSSNTTLNAHIDQCLSIKWTSNPKQSIKHRIKPKKTRLMADIYETALRCTLEDLDRRNGTNWTKVRTLSELGDLLPCKNVGYDKPVKTDKGNKFGMSKKKKCLVQKNKILDPCLHGQGFYCPEPKVKNGQEEESKGFKDLRQHHIANDQSKSDYLGRVIKQWVGSKRTGLREKVNLEHESSLSRKREKKPRIKTGDSSSLSSRTSQHHHTFSPGANEFSYPRNNSFSRAMTSRGMKFSSLRKKLLSSVRHQSVLDSREKLRLNHLDFNKHGPCCESESEDETILSRIRIYGQDSEGLTTNASNNELLLNKTRVLINHKKKEGFINAGKGDLPSKAYETSSESIRHDEFGKTIDPFGDAYNGFAAFSNVEHISMFCGDEVGRDLVIAPQCSNDEAAEKNNSGETQRNYYADVDPIPIPGPPGSFLPSPGHMSSEEELNESSSLTTCRIREGEEHEVVVTNSTAQFSSGLVFNKTAEGLFLTNEPPTLSNTNPVLRLMGKNLTVMNKDESGSNMSCVENGLSTVNLSNEPHNFGRICSGGPPILENMQINMTSPILEKAPSNFRPIQYFSAHPCDSFDGNLSSSMKSHEYASECAMISKQIGTNFRMDPYFNVQPHVEFCGSRQKEIIVIDDSPEIGHGGFKSMKATNGMANYQTRGYHPLCAGSPFIQNRKIQAESFGKLINFKAEGSNALHHHPSSSTAYFPYIVDQLRPSFYFSHGFS